MTVKYSNNHIITVMPKDLLVSRYINNKLVSLTLELDGTIKDLIKKFQNTVNLSDEMFIQFSSIQRQNSDEVKLN